MDIEGLNTTVKRDGKARVSNFAAVGRGAFRRIRLSVSGEGTAVAEFLEGRERPGIEPGEVLPMAIYSDHIGDRMVRAMAKLHMGVDEAATSYTESDADMITRGFVIGSNSGHVPVWIADNGSTVTVISRTPDGGLPSMHTDPVHMVYAVPSGRKVTVNSDSLREALRMLDSGQMPMLLSPTGDVKVECVHSRDATFH